MERSSEGFINQSISLITYQIRSSIFQEADLAVASLTISFQRSEAIDFTVPYMHLGIGILFKKPEEKDPSFLNGLKRIKNLISDF